MTNLEKYSNFINTIWKEYIYKMSKDNNHPFLIQFDKLNKINKSNDKNDEKELKKIEKKKKFNFLQIKYKKTSFNYNEIFKEVPCFKINEKIILEKYIYDIYDYMKDSKNINMTNLQKKLDKFDNFSLTSRINVKDHLKKFKLKNNTDINILILGGGPSGMYLMNKLYYNNWIGRKINIILIESRVNDENIRKPFTRYYTFGFNPDLINNLFPKISCLNLGALQIKYLEILLYVYGYSNKLPFYFTKKFINKEQIESFIHKYKIDVFFDCTGGRFINDYFTKTPNYLKNFKLKNDTNEIIVKENKAEVVWINDSIKNRYWVHFDYSERIDKETKIYFDKYQLIKNKYEIELVKILSNKCLKIKDKLSFINNFLINIKNKFLRYHFINLIRKKNLLKINLVDTKMYHLLNISALINKNKTIYIGVGDTIYSGHFVLGAGLNRTYGITDMIINMIQSI